MDDMEYLIQIMLYGPLLLILLLVYLVVYDWYKEKEWRRNNPDEHNIMERKIKDDFSE